MWKLPTHSARERLASLPGCQYTSKRKVAGFVGKCERTVGSQQGDIIACRVATMGEVTHVRPRISGKDGEDSTLRYISQTPKLQSVCLHICMYTVCVYLCVTTYNFLCLLYHHVCTLICVYVSLLLLS